MPVCVRLDPFDACACLCGVGALGAVLCRSVPAHGLGIYHAFGGSTRRRTRPGYAITCIHPSFGCYRPGEPGPVNTSVRGAECGVKRGVQPLPSTSFNLLNYMGKTRS